MPASTGNVPYRRETVAGPWLKGVVKASEPDAARALALGVVDYARLDEGVGPTAVCTEAGWGPLTAKTWIERAMDIALIALLTFVGSAVGTLTGFGTSTIMVPVLVSFYPLPQALLLVAIIHWFGDIWKMLLFRSGVRWRLVLLLGVPGIIATVVGGLLVFQVPQELLSRTLGAFLLAYVVFILVNRRFKVPQTTATAVLGGALYGLFAGVFGVGGAVRGAFLAAYDLPKDVYIFTAGAIGLAVDTGRLATYWSQGTELEPRLLWGLLLFVPVSFAGAKVAERIVRRIPQERFRAVVAVFLGLVALKLLVLPPEAGAGQAGQERASRAAQPQLTSPPRGDQEMPAAERRPGGAAARRSRAARRAASERGRDQPHHAGMDGDRGEPGEQSRKRALLHDQPREDGEGFRPVQQRGQRCAAVGVLLAARQHRADASAGSREAN